MIQYFTSPRLGSPALVALLAVFLFSGGCASTSTPVAESSVRPGTEAASQTTSSATTNAAKIDINTAAIAELDKLELPGTKPSLSERIQGGRPYVKLEDLVTKKVISPAEFNLISGLITTGKDK